MTDNADRIAGTCGTDKLSGSADAMATRSSSSGVVILLAAAALLSFGPAFLPSPVTTPRTATMPDAAVMLAGAAAPLLVMEPAHAESPSPPGLPFVIVFFGLFFALFVIPNAIAPGPRK